MKRIVTLALASICFFSAEAQQLSGGVRTGASLWINHHEGNCFTSSDARKLSWDKELFLRYQTKGKLAFEFAAGYYWLYNIGARKEDLNSYNPGYYNTGINEKSQNIEWNISAQYDLSCPAMQSCKVLSNLKSYVGIVATPTLSRVTTELQYRRISDGMNRSTISSRDQLTIWTGLNHTLVYNLNDHLYVSSVARLQIDPNRFFEKNAGVSAYPDSRFGVQIGIGYNF